MTKKTETEYKDIMIDDNKYLMAITHTINDGENTVHSHVSLLFYKKVGLTHAYMPLYKEKESSELS